MSILHANTVTHTHTHRHTQAHTHTNPRETKGRVYQNFPRELYSEDVGTKFYVCLSRSPLSPSPFSFPHLQNFPQPCLRHIFPPLSYLSPLFYHISSSSLFRPSLKSVFFYFFFSLVVIFLLLHHKYIYLFPFLLSFLYLPFSFPRVISSLYLFCYVYILLSLLFFPFSFYLSSFITVSLRLISFCLIFFFPLGSRPSPHYNS